jgi:Lrp/AsnC family transcriptional regulator
MEWSDQFRQHAARIPQVCAFYRFGGDWNYMLKIIANGLSGNDSVYRQLITGLELETVTGFFSMETIFEDHPLHVLS